MGTHPVSPTIRETLKTLDALSSHGLLRRDDLGVLLEAAVKNGHEDLLDKLSFDAKFVSHSVRLLERMGPAVPEVERLQRELSASLERVGTYIRSVFSGTGAAVPARFENEYLALRPDAAQNLITLCHDLRWYKNLQIDLSRERKNPKRERRST